MVAEKDKSMIVGADTQPSQQRDRQEKKRQNPIINERRVPRAVIARD
jgi:hypothetical protein